MDPTERRGFLAMLAGVLTGWFTGLLSGIQDRMNRCDAAETSEKYDRTTRYIVIAGVTLPTADGDPSFFPVDQMEFQPHSTFGAGKAVFAKTGPFVDFPAPWDAHREGRYPIPAIVPVMPDVLVGTIDELVADYRHKLIKATKAMDAQPALLQNREQQQERLDRLYLREGQAISVPFDADAYKNYLAKREIARAVL